MPGSDFYLGAFWELNSDRPVGMGMADIPFTSIDRFALRHGIEGEEFDFLRRMIRIMDRVAMEHWREKEGGQGAKAAPAGRPMSPGLFDALFS